MVLLKEKAPRKESYSDARVDEELEEERPSLIVLMSLLLKMFFSFYDWASYQLYFRWFVKPEERVLISERVKARKVKEGSGYAIWRHVDTAKGELLKDTFRGCHTLGQVWTEAVRCHGELPCMGTRKVLDVKTEMQPDGKEFKKVALDNYTWLSYIEVETKVIRTCMALQGLGLKKGDHITLYAETRAEWMICALACFHMGLTVVTIYPTLGQQGITDALTECKSVLIFTTSNLLPNLLKCIVTTKELKHIVYFQELHSDPSADGLTRADEQVAGLLEAMGISHQPFEELVERFEKAELGVKLDKATADDTAMIMYTSGTTGKPKGVILTHRNIVTAIGSQSEVVELGRDDTCIGYLPLAHIMEVCCELVCMAKGCRIGYSSSLTLIDKAPKLQAGISGDCTVLKPTLIACVPAIMDKIFKAITDRVKAKKTWQREFFRIAYERKRARQEAGYISLVLDKLVFSETRKLLGGKLRVILSGGAHLNAETQLFMNICFCCPVVQGYGLTESCGGATLADISDLSTGSVGPPLRCCEIMLRAWAEGGYTPLSAVPRGEILLHGAHISPGYYEKPEQTKEAFIEIDGKRWFATGDVGEFRPDGSLCIIDRKKDLVKLAHGEYIALGGVEKELQRCEFVDNICVVARVEHNFIVALIVPNVKAVTKLANDELDIEGMPWPMLCADPEVGFAVQTKLNEFARGNKVKQHEIPAKVFLCAEPWESDTETKPGLLTETKKLKRKAIENEFQREINKMFNPHGCQSHE